MTLEDRPDGGAAGTAHSNQPVPAWVEHEAWMAVIRRLSDENEDLFQRFTQAFGYEGGQRPDREIQTELLPVAGSETPYRPPVTTDEHLDEELKDFARLVALHLEKEITDRLGDEEMSPSGC
ncbi:hypothetical protein [Haloarcula sediminis]|uniref:hypothetical protein n=1 Tax=Haloarcula sediminis TaxID=3111777 RepID=UPI002D769F52|nr:hypothetical protein [Haloarcula sp. CK38]